MSRAGKYPVKLAEGVSVAIVDDVLVVKGPLLKKVRLLLHQKMQKKKHLAQCGVQWHAISAVQ